MKALTMEKPSHIRRCRSTADPHFSAGVQALLLQAIASHVDWDTGECHPRVATLARMMKCSETTVRRHLKRLAEGGQIAIEERSRQDGSQGAHQIVLTGVRP